MGNTPLSVHLIRAAERPRIHRQLPTGKNPLSYAYHALTDANVDSRVRAFVVDIQSGILEEIPMVSHDGEELVVLLEGDLEFRSPDVQHRLTKGDALHFDARIPHAFINLGKKPARALAVILEK